MMLQQENNKSLLLVSLVILISRIPYLFSGYGSEEDAWGLILVARNISLTGIYEVSRLPGHPVQELLLAQMWELPSWLLNLFTALISSISILFFMLTLRLMSIRNVIPAGIAMAFVPVFYINSTNIMDYTWALSLVIIAMHQVVNRNIVTAAIILGIACGFRITAGAMVIPFAALIYLQDKSIKKVFILGAVTSMVALICYLPAFYVYGSEFFTYYEYFPYPPFLKNVYKGTVGAWGLPGMVAVTGAVAVSFLSWKKMKDEHREKYMPILIMCALAMLLYTYSFLKIPQKSAFVLPMIPFIIIFLAIFLSRKMMLAFAGAMIISCFFVGINLDDPLRGSKASPLALRTKIGNTPVSVDLLSGMVIADDTKRKQKINYAKSIVKKLESTKTKTVIIAGWWQNELNYFALKNPNTNVSHLYYADENQLRDSILTGNKIYYLPEQDFYNDLRFQKKFTNEIAEAFE